MIKITNPLKYFGGSSYIVKPLLAMVPEHLTYSEAYCGAMNLLFAKNPEGISEVVNDIWGDLTTFWQVLASEELFSAFRRMAQVTPFSQELWENARDLLAHPGEASRVERAHAFFVCCRQSMTGVMKNFAAVSKDRIRRGMNEQVSAWLGAVEGLPEVHARLKRVLILNRPALEVIRTMDHVKTFHFLDPPFLPETRSGTGQYRHEMTNEDHEDLLVRLGGNRAVSALLELGIPNRWEGDNDPVIGKFLLLGYQNPRYDKAAEYCGWKRTEFDVANHAAGGKEKRRMTTCAWTNY